jgi:hypothetical protein
MAVDNLKMIIALNLHCECIGQEIMIHNELPGGGGGINLRVLKCRRVVEAKRN